MCITSEYENVHKTWYPNVDYFPMLEGKYTHTHLWYKVDVHLFIDIYLYRLPEPYNRILQRVLDLWEPQNYTTTKKAGENKKKKTSRRHTLKELHSIKYKYMVG